MPWTQAPQWGPSSRQRSGIYSAPRSMMTRLWLCTSPSSVTKRPGSLGRWPRSARSVGCRYATIVTRRGPTPGSPRTPVAPSNRCERRQRSRRCGPCEAPPRSRGRSRRATAASAAVPIARRRCRPSEESCRGCGGRRCYAPSPAKTRPGRRESQSDGRAARGSERTSRHPRPCPCAGRLRAWSATPPCRSAHRRRGFGLISGSNQSGWITVAFRLSGTIVAVTPPKARHAPLMQRITDSVSCHHTTSL
jgi:hypothetical protein